MRMHRHVQAAIACVQRRRRFVCRKRRSESPSGCSERARWGKPTLHVRKASWNNCARRCRRFALSVKVRCIG
ncbi:hypothetical protein D3C86_1708380 [compost metagenome]